MLLDIIQIGAKIIDKIIPDPEARDKAKLELMKQQQDGAFRELEILSESDKAQSRINEKEAENPSLFVSGWRPAIGWICVFALGYQMLVRPLFTWLMGNLFGWTASPSLELDTLITLMFGMLGLGAYRTVEKVKGVARK